MQARDGRESRGGSPTMCEGWQENPQGVREQRWMTESEVRGRAVRGGGSPDENGKEEGVNAKVQDNYPHGWQCVFHFDQVCVFLRSPIRPPPEPVPHLFPRPDSSFRFLLSLCPYIIAGFDGQVTGFCLFSPGRFNYFKLGPASV